MKRRIACLRAIALLMSLAGLGHAAHAADRDDRTTALVVNFPAGGPLDVAARLIAEKLRVSLRQNIVVDNRAGASGNIGAAYVAKAAPDGQTILFTTDAPLVANQLIFPSIPFKPRELKAVALIGSVPSAITVNASSGMRVLADLVKKGKQGPVTFSSSGAGSPAHIGAAMLGQSAGMQINHIPYKGGGPAALALAAGEVDAGVLALPGIQAFVKDGRLKPLAITSSRRSTQLPEVPTTAELGYPEVQTDLLFLAMVPARTPQATVSRLQSAIGAALADAAIQDKLRGFGVESDGATGADAADAALESLRTRYTRIIQQARIQVD